MEDDLKPATKADLTELRDATKADLTEFRNEITQTFDTKLDVVKNEITLTFDTKLEVVKDEIIRAFRLTEENIRADCAHVDEVAGLDTRVTRIENHLELQKP